MIIGCPGSGKSSLSRLLAKQFDYPTIFLDQHYWSEGWKETPEPQWRETVEKLVRPNRWVMDGNYSGTWDLRLPRSQMVIYLDYPTHLSLYRAIKRMILNYGKVRVDMKEGCPERFNWGFFQYIIKFRKSKRTKNFERLKKLEHHAEVKVFSNPRELKRWLVSLIR